MEVIKDNKNDLLKRREIQFIVESDSNPGFESVKKETASKFKADESLIAIKSLKNNFGANQFVVEAFVYDSKEAMDKIEPKKKVAAGGTQ